MFGGLLFKILLWFPSFGVFLRVINVEAYSTHCPMARVILTMQACIPACTRYFFDQTSFGAIYSSIIRLSTIVHICMNHGILFSTMKLQSTRIDNYPEDIYISYLPMYFLHFLFANVFFIFPICQCIFSSTIAIMRQCRRPHAYHWMTKAQFP